MRLEPDQQLAAIFLREAFDQAFPVLIHALDQIARHTNVDRSVLSAGHDVDVTSFQLSSMHWKPSGSWTPAFAGAHLRCRQQLPQCRAELRWAWADGDPGRFHRRDLAFGVALAAGDDRAGVAHPAPRRGGAAGDEADDRLPAAAPRLVGEELCSILFRAAADLAD